MRLIRIYIDQPLAPDSEVVLSEAATAHLTRVLRLGIGDRFAVFNGDGRDYLAVLQSLSKRAAVAHLIDASEVATESPLRITLAQAIARGEKMDWVLQKATELGAARIVPLLSERTEVRLDSERALRRVQHWQGVIAAACEQCGRAQLPSLFAPQPLLAFAADCTASIRFVLAPGGYASIRKLELAASSEVVLIVGPEGGLADREIAQLERLGFAALSFGPRILRTETAGAAVIAALQARFGDAG